MGSGIVFVTTEPDKVLAVAKEHDVEVQQVGYVSDKPEVIIRNIGALQREDWLIFQVN